MQQDQKRLLVFGVLGQSDKNIPIASILVHLMVVNTAVHS